MNRQLTIKQLRALKGLSQQEVSKTVGISREHLGKMENSFEVLRSARTDTILALADLYGVGIDEIIFFD